MSESGARVPRVLAIDAGGTMTDTFIVDERGSFVVGKAQTTPEDESIGFMASARDALGQWDSTPEEGFPAIVSGIYSGTAMLNRLLQRQGLKIGCIVNAGHEDYLRLERGHPDLPRLLLLRPPAPRDPLPQRAAGPARADEGRARADRRVRRRGPAAARAGRDARPRSSCSTRASRASSSRCCSPTATPRTRCAWRRSSRRRRPGAASTARSRSSSPRELYPMRRDLPRLNSTVIEAYAAEPSRATLKAVRDVTKDARRAVRAAGDGRARRNDLDRGQGARAHARLRPDRRRRRRAGAGAADGAAQRALHRHRRHVLRHRADHRRTLRDHPDARHRALHAEHAARPDRLDRRRHGVVRAREPELEPARARARLGRARGSASAGRRAASRRCRSPT